MHFGIIAAGEGSRLRQEGMVALKPMVEIEGMPLVERLVRIFAKEGADSVSIIVNESLSDLKEYIKSLGVKYGLAVNLGIKNTPSSMHTFGELLSLLPNTDKFIVTTVDTVFREEDFHRYVEAFRQTEEKIDGMMAVTDYVDDEKPLYVSMADDMSITGFHDDDREGSSFVSAGVYGLGKRAEEVLRKCIDKGCSRMRNYQRELLAEGLSLKAFPIGKVVDVDHVEDIKKAENLLKS